MPRAEQEQIAKVHFGALSQALLLDRSEYVEVVRDHAVAVTWVPAGANFVSQYQDPERVFVEHNQEGVGPPQISLPVLGTTASDAVVALRVLKDLVNAGSPQKTITLQLDWTALESRFLLEVDPATLPAERYKTMSFRVGQSTEPKNVANRDQDSTIEISSGSRTAAVPVSTLHRLVYPDVVFGAGKIVMQTLRLPLARLDELGVDLTDIRSIAFVADRRSTGTIYVGDVQLSN